MVSFKLAVFCLSGLFISSVYAQSISISPSFSLEVEKVEKTYTGKTSIDTGTIDYQYPGHLKVNYISPIESLLIINSKEMIKYDPNFDPKLPGEINKYSKINNSLLNLLDNLHSKKEKLFDSKIVAGSLVLVILNAKQNELGAKEIVFSPKKGVSKLDHLKDVSEITFVKLNDLKNTIKIKEFKDMKFPAKHFEFTPPPKTKIISN